MLKRATEFLLESGLVEIITEGFTQSGGGLKPTTLGKAIVASALSIDEGLFVQRELRRSMRAFVLDDELVFPFQNEVIQALNLPLHSSLHQMRS